MLKCFLCSSCGMCNEDTQMPRASEGSASMPCNLQMIVRVSTDDVDEGNWCEISGLSEGGHLSLNFVVWRS